MRGFDSETMTVVQVPKIHVQQDSWRTPSSGISRGYDVELLLIWTSEHAKAVDFVPMYVITPLRCPEASTPLIAHLCSCCDTLGGGGGTGVAYVG